MHGLAQHRANFAKAHGGYYFVQLGLPADPARRHDHA